MEGFGERLRKVMVERRLSYQMVGQAVGVSSQAVHKWVNGGGISPEHVLRLADFFGLSPSVLFFGDDNALSRREVGLLYKFRELTTQAQASVEDFLEYQSSVNGNRPDDSSPAVRLTALKKEKPQQDQEPEQEKH